MGFVEAQEGQEGQEVKYVAVVRPRTHKEGFTMLFQQGLLDLVCNPETRLSSTEWRLLAYLCGTMEYENQTEQYVSEMAQALGQDRSTVSKALDRLELRGLVQRLPGVGRRPGVVLVNPLLAFRGRVGQRARVLREGVSRLNLLGRPVMRA